MSLKINFRNSINENKIKNYILFSDENFQIRGLKRLSISKDAVKINKTITNNKLKDKDFLIFNLNPTQKILLVVENMKNFCLKKLHLKLKRILLIK